MEAVKELGKQMRKQRKKKGWTQPEAAEAIGIKLATYRNYELGLVKRPTKIMQQIKDSELFAGTYRIVDIPDFYERLNELCNANGNIIVDVNDPRLQDLRAEAGGERVLSTTTGIGRF